jgi:hypothetical protein
MDLCSNPETMWRYKNNPKVYFSFGQKVAVHDNQASFKNWLNQATAAFFPRAIASRSPLAKSAPLERQEYATPGKCW